MTQPLQTCFNCADLQAKLEALTQERDNLMALYETAHARATAAELQGRRLKAELNGSTTKETQAVREVCEYHDEKWKQAFPRARGLKYPMDGVGPKKIRWALRREFTVDDCKKAIDGAFSDSWYLGQNDRQTPYVKLANILRDEELIYDHIARAEGTLTVAQRDRVLTARERRMPRPKMPVELGPLPTEAELAAMQSNLLAHENLLRRVYERKRWTPSTLQRLGVGFDGQRLVFPIRDQEGELVNVSRYNPSLTPKMMAPKGRPRNLYPAPETLSDDEVWVVEGEPDAVTAYEFNLPAVGVPGAGTWHDDWTVRFEGMRVVVCFDCDEPGRRGAASVSMALAGMAKDVRMVDLDANRTDGWDLGDFMLAGGTSEGLRALAASAAAVHTLRAA